MPFALLKRAYKYGLLFFGAIVCHIFASDALMASASLKQLGPEVMLVLLVFGPPSCAVALVIGVLGAFWLAEGPRSGYVLSLVLAIFWSIITVSSRPLKLNLVLILSLCEIPVVTFIGSFIYAKVHKLKSKVIKVVSSEGNS